MKNLLLFISVLLLSIIQSTATAQELELGFNGRMALPQEQFGENINSPGGGLNVFALYRFDDIPFGLGLDFSFMDFGTLSHTLPRNSTENDLSLNIQNSFRTNQAMAITRIHQRSGILQAYVEGLAGFNFFFSETTVTGRGQNSSNTETTQSEFKNIAFSWGGGAGMLIRLHENRNHGTWIQRRDNLRASFLSIGFRYLHGSEAEYIQDGAFHSNTQNGILNNSRRTSTDLLMVQFGFGFVFNN